MRLLTRPRKNKRLVTIDSGLSMEKRCGKLRYGKLARFFYDAKTPVKQGFFAF